MILIRKRPDGIVGIATPPHVKETWIAEEPLPREVWWREMTARGSHPSDTAAVLNEIENSGFGYMP